MEFRCNLRCVHCMIEGTMDRLKPESTADFRRILARNARSREWDGLILTGAEITLNPNLPAMARAARDAGFRHVRIQTHGMSLDRPETVQTLVEAGVDEYFVSVTGPDAESHDAITGVPRAFDRMMHGLDLLDAFEGVTILTNTVVTTRSFDRLAEVVDRLSHLRRLRQMEFWVYLPMAEEDDKNLVARHTDVLPHLRVAASRAQALGRAVEIKNFPPCLLGDLAHLVLNEQPELHIDPAFWPEFMRNGFYQCVHRDRCAATDCLGLSTAYIGKFGWEAARLSPMQYDPRHRRDAARQILCN
ncbi:radical SAM protein [Aestuariicoccus sp. KMU-90]|uniref:Radical SAM protein n=2 Tax=Thetidibacter halocola TaxID=2827239 RepID=A0A8J7WFP6_9RHOB|nr:radical SAM protein [Thetidibacter halocola]